MVPKPQVIAITVTALLVAGVLLVIDPPKRFRWIQDRETEAKAGGFLKAVENYYKVFFEYPWDVLGQPDPDGTAVQQPWLRELVTKEGLDQEFAEQPPWSRIYVTQDATTIHVCFDPVSKKFQQQADEEGAFDCLSDCWVCLPPTNR